MLKNRKIQKILTGHVMSICLLGILVLLAAGSSEDAEEKAKREKYGDKTSAFVMAQTFVEKTLKSPGSAEYGWQTADECVTDLGEGKYKVSGWVDAQNSFGAKIRSYFSLELKYVGDDSWRCTKGPNMLSR